MVKACQYISITSVMLLDCFTIPCVIIFTRFFLKTKYRIKKLTGAAICIAGIVIVIFSDVHASDRAGGSNPLKGDLLVTAGSILYAVKLEKVICTNAKFSEDGSRLMVMKSDSTVNIYDCSSSKEIRSFAVPNMSAATMSPCGTYLQTFQKSSTPQEKNVILWKTETGAPVYQHFQKNMTKTTCSSSRRVLSMVWTPIQQWSTCCQV